jgi:hypothetical protein
VALRLRRPKTGLRVRRSRRDISREVSFTNDDGSGTFNQATSVRFDVEEIFKGLTPGTKQVWVDPGSFTSCYEEYHLGERYLIIGRRKGLFPSDSASMTVVRGKVDAKPIPPGIDPTRWAPECSGSRPADHFPHIEMDYAMLRAYRAGQPMPRVFGRVYLEPFRGWPKLDGPRIRNAQVTLANESITLRATTSADGTFALASAPAGAYSITAALPPFVLAQPRTIITIPEVGCGSEDVALRTTSELRGSVLDFEGRPASGIPVKIEVLGASDSEYRPTIEARTDTGGRFALVGVPEAAVRLSYGAGHPSSEGVPYPLI